MMQAEEVVGLMLSMPRVSTLSADTLRRAVGMFRDVTRLSDLEMEPLMTVLSEATEWCRRHGEHATTQRHLDLIVTKSRDILAARKREVREVTA